MFTREADCESLQRFELRAVHELSGAVPAWTADKICAALHGWEIRVHHHEGADVLCPARAWEHLPGLCVWGFTWADKRVIEVSSSEWDKSALVHEIAHAVGDVITHDIGHCRWGDAKFRAVLEALQGEEDGNRPEKSCSH